MRYWLSHGDGQVHGPYELEDLRAYVAQGRVTGATQLCQDGTNNWVPASSVLGVGPTGLPPTSPAASTMGGFPGAPAGWTPVSLVGPILVTVFCCLIGGIISIVYASSANNKALMGDIAGAEAAKRTSATWMWVSLGLGLVFTVLYIGLMAITAANSGP